MTTHITFTYTDYTGFRVLFVVCGNERSVFSEQTSFTVWDTSGSIMHKGGYWSWDTVMDIVYGICQARRLYSA